jgi:hypothetical protein
LSAREQLHEGCRKIVQQTWMHTRYEVNLDFVCFLVRYRFKNGNILVHEEVHCIFGFCMFFSSVPIQKWQYPCTWRGALHIWIEIQIDNALPRLGMYKALWRLCCASALWNKWTPQQTGQGKCSGRIAWLVTATIVDLQRSCSDSFCFVRLRETKRYLSTYLKR